MGDVGLHQSNIVNNIVSHMSGLEFIYPPQGCQETTYAPITTPITHADPMMAPTVQPAAAVNAATNAASNITPQLLTIMQHMQQLMVHMKVNQSGVIEQKVNRNTHFNPTWKAATEPRQGQPHKLLPDFAMKYWWIHGKCAHIGVVCNNKAPKHQETATFLNKRNGSTYVCTWQVGF